METGKLGRSWSFRKSDIEKSVFHRKLEVNKRENHLGIWENSTSEGGDNKCKSLEVGACLAFSRKSEKASAGGAQSSGETR